MTVLITQPAKDLREELSKGHTPASDGWDIQKFTGDSSEVRFAIRAGWEPFSVHVDGLMVREGTGDAYTVPFDGFIYPVVFDTAPGAVNIDVVIRKTQ
tara:strand:- start:224 stop:517 length:294 start_codon:yes stop_codon:yes gene_type:complete